MNGDTPSQTCGLHIISINNAVPVRMLNRFTGDYKAVLRCITRRGPLVAVAVRESASVQVRVMRPAPAARVEKMVDSDETGSHTGALSLTFWEGKHGEKREFFSSLK